MALVLQNRWFILFRWGAVVGKCAALLVVHFALAMRVPSEAPLVLLAIEATLNLVATLWCRSRTLGVRTILALMVIDVLLLTGLLYFTGGASNPFNFVYLIYLALAAVSLPIGMAWLLAGITALCFAALFLVPVSHHHGPHEMALHLQGMWVAFVVAAFFIVFFIHRLRRELADQRERLERAERLASVTTLAAGAAHELSTPLSTIAVAANELRHAADDQRDFSIQDIELIRTQVDRCKDILGHLRGQAGDISGETVRPVSLGELCAPLQAEFPSTRFMPMDATQSWVLPADIVRSVMRSLIQNAADASQEGEEVRVEIERTDARIQIRVTDQGCGISAATLKKVRDPFFTTKPSGQGMGLGLYLATVVAEQLGGALTLDSDLGKGTEAVFEFPATWQRSDAERDAENATSRR